MTSASVPLQEIIRERELLEGGEMKPEKNEPIAENRFPCKGRAGVGAATTVNSARGDDGKRIGETVSDVEEADGPCL